MKTKVLLLFILMGSVGFSQNNLTKVDSIITAFTSHLQQKNIHDYIITQRFCNGKIVIYKQGDKQKCTSGSTNYESYIVWKEIDKTYVRKIDNCGLFESVPISSDAILKFANENFQLLKSEQVKEYETSAPLGEPERRTEVYPCERNFKVTSANESVSQHYKLLDMTSLSDYPNKYFEHNTNLKINELDRMFTQVIEEMEKSEVFSRTELLETKSINTLEEPKFEKTFSNSTLKDGGQ